MKEMIRNVRFDYRILAVLTALVFITFSVSCERDDDDVELASFPDNAEIFIDGFTPGLVYQAFGESNVEAFQVDEEVKYKGFRSMRFEIPGATNPKGAFAGGVFRTEVGRDLTGYNVLTFWAKASKGTTVDEFGFGNALKFGGEKYKASITKVPINSNWQKYYIPLPDPSVLTEERGMFYFVEADGDDAGKDGSGYTFWVDELKFENLSTIVAKGGKMLNGKDVEVAVEAGVKFPIDSLFTTFNLPAGIDLDVNSATAYFDFKSSDQNIASVDSLGVVTALNVGEATITTTLKEKTVNGSIELTVTAPPPGPLAAAPVPEEDPNDVTSIFSNVYDDEPVDFFNGFWEFSTTQSADYQVEDDDIIRYTQLNFVGIQFTTPTIDVSNRDFFHMDIWTPEATEPASDFKILLFDLGPDGAFGGGDDSGHEITITNPTLKTEEWISLDIPFSDFPGLTGRANLAQIVLSSATIPTVYVDNIYFYSGEGGGPGLATSFPITFENNETLSGVFEAGQGVTGSPISNPDPSGINPSATVYEFNKANGAAWYSGLFHIFPSNIDLNSTQQFTFKIWSPKAGINVRMTLEKEGGGGGPTVTLDQTITTANTWVELTYDFSGLVNVSDAYDKFVIFPDFDDSGQPPGDGSVYYLDDIVQGSGGGSGPPLATSFPVDFESNETISGVFEEGDGVTGAPITNPDQSGINTSATVYEFNKVNGAAWYSGLFHVFPADIDPADGTSFVVKIWSPKANINLRFQLEKEGNQGPIPTYNIDQTVTQANTWVEVVFDFSSTAINLADGYDKFVIFPDFDDSGQPPGDGSVYYIDDIDQGSGSGGGGNAPTTSAPVPPARDAADVISIYGGTYTNISGINYDPNWGQSGHLQVDPAFDPGDGNLALAYPNFNYQGTDFSGNPQDASSMEFLHVDMWTPDATVVQVTPINGSGTPNENLVSLTPINSGQWNSYDIPMSDFTGSGMTVDQIVQLKFDGQAGVTPSDIYLDNIYFYKAPSGGGNAPTTSAPLPPARDAADVISIYGGTYTNIGGINYDPNWGQSGHLQVDPAYDPGDGNLALAYPNFNYQGTDFSGNPQDASAMEFLHVDMWTPDATVVQVTPINGAGAPTENLVSLTPISSGQWNSYDIPMNDFTGSGMTVDQIVQLKFDGQAGVTPSDIYLDNIYFWKAPGGGNAPTTSAPVPPARNAADVISFYGESYANISGINYDPNWGQSGHLLVNPAYDPGNGNLALAYPNFNYQGTDFSGNAQDASAMEFLHVDMWTPDATVVQVTPINGAGAPTENLVSLTPLNNGQWNSYDIPVGDFTASGMTLDQVIQLKFDGQAGVTPSDIYLDNIYFWKAPSGGGELAINGDFETGDDTGWMLFQNGGTAALDNTINNGGSWSGRLATGGPSNPAFKQERIGAGTVTSTDVVQVQFDYTGSVVQPGAVFNVILFGEGAAGASFTHIFSPAPTPTGSWTTFTDTFTITGQDVSQGISVLIEAVCGGDVGCSVTANIDNLSVTLNP